MIRLAAPGDAAAVAESYEELLLHEEREGGSSHWRRGVYPTAATAGRAQAAGWLYVLEEDGRLQGSVILNSLQAKEYRSIPWLYPAADGEVLVVHTLCVPPRCAGRGVGTRLVDFALGFAYGAGMRAVRLDTNALNIPAQRLYQKLGFRLAGRSRAVHEGVLDTELVYLERQL